MKVIYGIGDDGKGFVVKVQNDAITLVKHTINWDEAGCPELGKITNPYEQTAA